MIYRNRNGIENSGLNMQLLHLSAKQAPAAMRRMLFYVLFWVLGSSYQGAAFAGNACMPFGYGTGAGSSPVTSFIATRQVSTKKLLFQRTWTPPLSTTACIADTNASFFIAPDFSGTIFNTNYRRVATQITNGVQIEFEANDDATVFGISQPLFTIKYTTTMVCGRSGVLTVAADSTGTGFIISGINSRAGCDGNYLVTYDIQVWQAATTSFPSLTTSAVLGGPGFKEFHEMRDDRGNKAFGRSGSLGNSMNNSFVANVGCTVSIDNSSITLPTTTVANIRNNPGLSTSYFDITLKNCQGGNLNPPLGVMLTWRFMSVHPSDATLLTNGDTSSAAAKNIALKMFWIGPARVNRIITHQLPISSGYSLPTDSSSVLTIRHFVQYDLTPEGRADNSIVQPGRFAGQAQLFVQYQ
jgi:hypothetical protein